MGSVIVDHAPEPARGGPPSVLRSGTDLAGGVAATLAAALASLPLAPAAAWATLLATVTAVGWFAGRAAGWTAAAATGLLYMWIHGPDPFAATITDQWTIRFGFLLAATGALAALIADAQHGRRRGRPPVTTL